MDATKLVAIAAAIHSEPSMAQVDEMLKELSLLPAYEQPQNLVDQLLDIRSLLLERAKATVPEQ